MNTHQEAPDCSTLETLRIANADFLAFAAQFAELKQKALTYFQKRPLFHRKDHVLGIDFSWNFCTVRFRPSSLFIKDPVRFRIPSEEMGYGREFATLHQDLTLRASQTVQYELMKDRQLEWTRIIGVDYANSGCTVTFCSGEESFSVFSFAIPFVADID